MLCVPEINTRAEIEQSAVVLGVIPNSWVELDFLSCPVSGRMEKREWQEALVAEVVASRVEVL